MLNGLTDIWEFAGGLKAWLEQGLAIEGKPNAQVLGQLISGSFLLDAEKSVIKLAGSNLTNSHTGRWGSQAVPFGYARVSMRMPVPD